MAIFKKNDPQPQKPRERSGPPPRNLSGDAAISIIGQGMTVVGDITTEGIVRVEGQVRGTVQASKAVILGQGGVVDGNVLTEDAVIGGTVSGSIVAENRLELQSTCLVRGEIRTRAEHLKLEEGARFAGQVQMIEEDVPENSATGDGAAAGSPDQGQPAARAGVGATENKDPGKTASPDGARANGDEGRGGDDSDGSGEGKRAEAEAGQPAESGK